MQLRTALIDYLTILQEVGDARMIRNQILSNFELATQLSIAKEESKRLLHVVIVGGGPTGVEFGAEIYDFVEQVWLFYLVVRKPIFSTRFKVGFKLAYSAEKHSYSLEISYMSGVMRKPVFGVSSQVRHKPGYTSTEDG